MNLRHCPSPDEAMSSDQVLLEHWTTFCGRQLALRVTTADSASPDTVTVHVRYGGGLAEVIVSADEEECSEACRSAPDVPQTPDKDAGGLVEPKELCSPLEERRTEMEDLGRVSGANREISCPQGKEEPIKVPLSVYTTDEVLAPDAKQSEMAASIVNKEGSDEEPPPAAADGQAANASTRHAETSSSQCEERQSSEPLPESTLSHEVDVIHQQSGKSSTPASCQEQQHSALAAGGPEKTVKLVVSSQEKESQTIDIPNRHDARQCAVEATSLPREGEENAPATRRTELRIGRFDLPAVLDDKALKRMLQDMPELKRLCIDWRLDGRKLNVDIVSQHCPNLVELDLSRFRLDAWSLDQLCVACPGLEVVKMPRKSDDSCVEVLLHNLPKLRSLDLARTNVTGRFLEKSHESLETLSLANCKSLKVEQLGQGHPAACWAKVRELDLSSTQVTSAGLAKVLGHFRRLERLSLAYCSRLESAILLQVALCEKLQALNISHVGSLQASDLLAILVRCPQLEWLSLAGCSIEESSPLRQLDLSQAHLRLRELDVSGVKGLATADFEAIVAGSPQLERLIATRGHKIDLTTCLTQLSKCAELRELDVSLPMYSQMKGTALTSLLSGCPKLERLTLAGCCISESSSLSQLSQCPKLRELDLSRMTVPMDSGQAPGPGNRQSLHGPDLAQALSGCQALERLSVAGLKAPLELLVPTTGLPSLTYLDACQSGLTNNSLRRLPRLFPRLHTLNVQGCTSVSKDGLMSYLPCLEHLRSLDLRGTSGVSDAVLETLKDCPLTKLRISGKHITEDGPLKLVGGCPSLKLLMLEELESSTVKRIQDAFRTNLPHDRSLVLCFSGYSGISEQTAPLFVLGSEAINWDETDVSVVPRGNN